MPTRNAAPAHPTAPRIGCAGWSIPSAHAALFGAGDSHLARYATRFDVTEINSTFYRAHQAKTFERWAASVPARFRFSAKLPKAVTHEARLQGVGDALSAFFDALAGLGPKLGGVLVQLPPAWRSTRAWPTAFSPCCVAVARRRSRASRATRAGSSRRWKRCGNATRSPASLPIPHECRRPRSPAARARRQAGVTGAGTARRACTTAATTMRPCRRWHARCSRYTTRAHRRGASWTTRRWATPWTMQPGCSSLSAHADRPSPRRRDDGRRERRATAVSRHIG